MTTMEARNTEIRRYADKGETYAAIGLKFGLTSARISQILSAGRAREKKAKLLAHADAVYEAARPKGPKVAETCPKWLVPKVQGAIVDHFTSGLNGNLAEVSAALAWLGREVK